MGKIDDEKYGWVEPDLRTEKEKNKSEDEHKRICQHNKETMTKEEYISWMNSFD